MILPRGKYLVELEVVEPRIDKLSTGVDSVKAHFKVIEPELYEECRFSMITSKNRLFSSFPPSDKPYITLRSLVNKRCVVEALGLTPIVRLLPYRFDNNLAAWKIAGG